MQPKYLKFRRFNGETEGPQPALPSRWSELQIERQHQSAIDTPAARNLLPISRCALRV
jgi:hypothetical protein